MIDERDIDEAIKHVRDFGKPCPWCNTDKHLCISDDLCEPNVWVVVCDKCHCCGPDKQTPMEAFKAWQNRGELNP